MLQMMELKEELELRRTWSSLQRVNRFRSSLLDLINLVSDVTDSCVELVRRLSEGKRYPVPMSAAKLPA